MDDRIPAAILREYRGGYVVADRQLRVMEVGGDLTCFGDIPYTGPGQLLVDLIPELVGSQAELEAVLAGDLARFELAQVNRVTATGETVYFTLIGVSRPAEPGEENGLTLLAQNTTTMASLAQRLAQSRNESRLLQEQLARENQQLAGANAELRRLDEARSMFLAGVSHEILAPLGCIAGYLETMLDEDYGPLTSVQREYLDTAHASAARLMNVARNLLDLTRLQTGQVQLTLEPVALSSVAQAVAVELQPVLDGKEQCLTLHIAPNLKKVLFDPVRVSQIVTNLLQNASKYSPRYSAITLTIAQADQADHVQLAVEDAGIGIPPEDQDRVFDPFFRSRNAVQSGESGAGLGLYITRLLVELHGGQIWVESRPGKGSTFFVSFPAVGQAPVDIGPEHENNRGIPPLRVLSSRSPTSRKVSNSR
ncbi:MAG: HAMP domain-containing sensor histidine kinase [Anaerolineae bacterium]